MKLELTDGYKTVTAMEYSPVPILNTKLSPGLKVQIVGPLRVVNHILLLEPKNLKILGGDVEKLLIVNAYENVLLRALNRPTTDTPITDYSEAPLAAENNAPKRQIEAKPMLASKKVDSKPLQPFKKQDEKFLASIDFDDLDDEEFDMAEIVKLEEEGRRQIESRQPTRIQNQPIRSSNPSNDEDEEFLMDIDFEALENQVPESQRNERRPEPKKPATSNNSCNSATNSSSSVMRAPHQPTLPVAAVQPVKVYTIADDLYKFKSASGDNFATIDQFLALKPTDKMKRNFVIQAKLHLVVPNTLKVKSKQWSVRVELTDAYSQKLLPVQMNNKVLEKLSGHTAEKMSLMFIESKTKMQVKEEIFDVSFHIESILKIFDISFLQIVESLRIKIENLSCFMKIDMKFSPQMQSNCQVVELLEPSAENVSTFRRKVEEEKLLEVI